MLITVLAVLPAELRSLWAAGLLALLLLLLCFGLLQGLNCGCQAPPNHLN